jgi:hypothetical protein
MSFALEFRTKHFTARPAKAVAKPPKRSRSKRGAREGRAETQGARATTLGALVLAAAILAVFNSEGLRLYAGDLAKNQFGRPLLTVSEAWDGAMQRAGAKAVEEQVRGFVADLREARWTDLASAFGVASLGASAIERKGESFPAEPPSGEHTGAVPRPVKHGLDDGAWSARPRFDHSSASGR